MIRRSRLRGGWEEHAEYAEQAPSLPRRNAQADGQRIVERRLLFFDLRALPTGAHPYAERPVEGSAAWLQDRLEATHCSRCRLDPVDADARGTRARERT